MTDNEGLSNVESVEDKPEAEEKKIEAPAPIDPKAIDELRAENARLRETSEKAARDAAASQAYVHEIVSRLQATAASSGAPANEATDYRELMQENPIAVLDEHFAARMAPLINQSLEYQVQSAKELFEQRMATDDEYNAYKDELEEFMKGIPPAVKAQPKAWTDGMNFIRARHLDEIVEKRRKRQVDNDRKAFVEPAGSAGGRTPAPPTLNADQKAIAKGLGIPEEEYAKWVTA